MAVVHLVGNLYIIGGKNMSMVSNILSGTALLIAIYLVVKNAKGTASVINSLGGVYTKSIKTLQGR